MQGVKQLPAASKRQKNVTPGYRLRNFREN